MIRFLNYFGNWFESNTNIIGLTSASVSFVIDLLSSNNNLGTLIGILISAGIGFYAVLKARQSYLILKQKNTHQKELMELELLDRKNQIEHNKRMRDEEYRDATI